MSDTSTTRRGFLGALATGVVAPPLFADAERVRRGLERALTRVHGVGGTGDDAAALAAEYLLADDLTYLNHASIGTVPRAVHEAHVGYLRLCESHPSLYVWGRVWRAVTEDTRQAAAALLGCERDDLAITHNTTEGFNVLAHGLPLAPGDEVLFSSLNHPGASAAWRGLADRRGFNVRSFDFPVLEASALDEDAVVALHVEQIRDRTRALVLPHVDNAIGLRHPLPRLARAARARGVEFVLVDGAQSAGMIPVDLRGADVDAYAMSPHKWIQAPKGLGLLYVSAALRPRLPRMWHRTAGGDGSARAYEDYSTRAWPAVVALGDALAFQASLGAAEKERRYRASWARIRARVHAEAALSWRSPPTWSLGSMIVSVGVAGRRAPELGPRLLQEHGIVLRAFGDPLDALRLSPNVATTDAELDTTLDTLVSLAG